MRSPSVLLISIDALRPDLVIKSRVRLPNLFKYFIENGTYSSKGVRSVFPTFTYPCHHSIITGTYPATHGIYTNKVFDPMGTHLDAWNWYVSDKVPTLWDYAKQNGYLSVNVGFPTSVGAYSDYNIPEYWRDGSDLDSKVLDAVSRPQGIVKEVETKIGRYPAVDLSINGDRKRFQASLWMLENKVIQQVANKPFFMTMYFSSYDDASHEGGTFCDTAMEALVEIDKMIGIIIARAHQITGDNIVVCVVSDHGMMDNIADIRPNTLLYQAGLIKLADDGRVADWSAWCQRSGGVGQIKIKNSENQHVYTKVKFILEELVGNENSGVLEVLTGSEAGKQRKGLPEADFVIIAKPGYEIREDIIGEYYNPKLTQKAQHGYGEELPEMKASFFIEGINISSNKDIEELKLVDIAPTLAHIMGFNMPTAEGNNIL